jgi:hypothetical protein
MSYLSFKEGESMTLWNRHLNRVSAANWKAVLGHPQMGLHPRARQGLKRILLDRRNPTLIHKGGKP